MSFMFLLLPKLSVQACTGDPIKLTRFPLPPTYHLNTCVANPDVASHMTSFTQQCTFTHSNANNLAKCQSFCFTEPTCRILEYARDTQTCGICKDAPSFTTHAFTGHVMVETTSFADHINREFFATFCLNRKKRRKRFDKTILSLPDLHIQSCDQSLSLAAPREIQCLLKQR